MKDLINIQIQVIGGEEVNAIDARELHIFLKSKQDFSTWIKGRIKKYRFVEDADFATFHKIVEPPIGGLKGRIEYALSMDMGKELSMVENNDKGRIARKYFIACEKKVLSLANRFPVPQDYGSALKLAGEVQTRNQLLIAQAAKDRPLLEFAESVKGLKDAISMNDYVKFISNEAGFVVGRNNFFKWLRFEGILDSKNRPYQEYLDRLWFKLEERTYENENTNGPRSGYTTLVTGIGQIELYKRFKNSDYFKLFLNKGSRANKKYFEQGLFP